MLFSKQRQINELIPDNKDTGLVDTIKVLRPGTIGDIYLRVFITHPYTGDISIDLTSPSGTTVNILKRSKKPGKNISLAVNDDKLKKFLGEKAKGNWKLTVKDAAPKDSGFLNSWTLGFGLEQKDTEVFLTHGKAKDLSSKHNCHEKGSVKSIKGSLDLLHPSSNKLKVELVAPSGKSVVLFNKSKTAKKNLKKAFPKEVLAKLVGEKANGVWTLNVKDPVNADKARLKRWSLDIAVN